jgi:hypothetical protein
MRTNETFQNITILNARIVNAVKANDLCSGNMGDVRKLARFTPAYEKDGKYVPERYECILALNSGGRTAQYIPAVFWRRNAVNMARFATAGQSIDLIEARLNINQAFVDSTGNTTTADASRSGQDTARTYVQLDVSNFRLGDMAESEESEEVRLGLRPANWRNNQDSQTQAWKAYMNSNLWNMIPDFYNGTGITSSGGAHFVGRAALILPKNFNQQTFKILEATDERVAAAWKPSGFVQPTPQYNQPPAQQNLVPQYNQAPAQQNAVPAFMNQAPAQQKYNPAPAQQKYNPAPAQQNAAPAFMNQNPDQYNPEPQYNPAPANKPVQTNPVPAWLTPNQNQSQPQQQTGFAHEARTIASAPPNHGSFTGTAGC